MTAMTIFRLPPATSFSIELEPPPLLPQIADDRPRPRGGLGPYDIDKMDPLLGKLVAASSGATLTALTSKCPRNSHLLTIHKSKGAR